MLLYFVDFSVGCTLSKVRSQVRAIEAHLKEFVAGCVLFFLEPFSGVILRFLLLLICYSCCTLLLLQLQLLLLSYERVAHKDDDDDDDDDDDGDRHDEGDALLQLLGVLVASRHWIRELKASLLAEIAIVLLTTLAPMIRL